MGKAARLEIREIGVQHERNRWNVRNGMGMRGHCGRIAGNKGEITSRSGWSGNWAKRVRMSGIEWKKAEFGGIGVGIRHKWRN